MEIVKIDEDLGIPFHTIYWGEQCMSGCRVAAPQYKCKKASAADIETWKENKEWRKVGNKWRHR